MGFFEDLEFDGEELWESPHPLPKRDWLLVI